MDSVSFADLSCSLRLFSIVFLHIVFSFSPKVCKSTYYNLRTKAGTVHVVSSRRPYATLLFSGGQIISGRGGGGGDGGSVLSMQNPPTAACSGRCPSITLRLGLAG